MWQAILLEVKNTLVSAIVAALVASTGTYAANSLISGRQIRNHSIPIKKLTAAAVASLRGRQGPQGITGEPGSPGTFDPSGVSIYVGETQTVAAGATATLSADCPPGRAAVGGGAITSAGIVQSSFPYALGVYYPNRWDAVVMNPTTTDMTARIEVS